MVIPKSRAYCSRVTHPFAARVPRKALPLDLHVLRTPPAFVLSQDQTLQQKLALADTPAHCDGVAATRAKHQTGTTPPVRTKKLDTLLSSQKTPAHHRHAYRGQAIGACCLSCGFPPYTLQNQRFRGGPNGMISGPGDRSPRGPFCPASR